MRQSRITTVLSLALLVLTLGLTAGQPQPPRGKKAADALKAMLGTWEGTATINLPNGETMTIRQTERVGTMLDGQIVMVEGRGYNDAGDLVFNALGVISHNPSTDAWEMRSYTGGQSGTHTFEPTDDGFVWSVDNAAGRVRYSATIDGETWTQVGELLVEGREPRKTIEMDLKRTGDCDWPAAGAID